MSDLRTACIEMEHEEYAELPKKTGAELLEAERIVKWRAYKMVKLKLD